MTTIQALPDSKLQDYLRVDHPSQGVRDEALARLLERSKPTEPARVASLGNFTKDAVKALSGLASELDAVEQIETSLRVRNFIVWLEGLK